METAEMIQQIEDDKLEQLYRSVNVTVDEPMSPKKLEYLESRRLSDTGITALSFDKSISNFEAIFEDMENAEPVTFDKQDLLVGSHAKKKFWELYKSDRSFKDFNPEKDETNDPRFAYF